MSTSIYWVFFNLNRNDGQMKLVVDTKHENVAIKIAKGKAAKMSKEWVFDVACCAR